METAKKNDGAGIPRPRLVLRVGFAGKREYLPSKDRDGKKLTGEEKEKRDRKEQVLRESVEARLEKVLTTIGSQLVELAPHTKCQLGPPPAISQFYQKENPLMRVITGLCEGSDTLAFNQARELAVDCLEVENASVIGFPLGSYRGSRDSGFEDEFDEEVKKSAYILEGDGKMDSGNKKQRARGYRLQSDLLMRQSDLMIVVVDPETELKAGGSLETARKALEFQLPVVLIRPSGEGVQVLEYDENLPDQLEHFHEEDWEQQLRDRVTNIVADPFLSENTFRPEEGNHGEKLLREFFSGETPEKKDEGFTWKTFLEFFKTRREKEAEKAERDDRNRSGGNQPKREASYDGKSIYDDYRSRASLLSGIYAGNYRNTFFRNARYAVGAVILATVSLLLLSQHLVHPSPALLVLLVILAAWKLGLVVSIYRSSHKANHDHWNDRTVDYRYLAERLRAMKFLPEARIWQPPAAAPPQYASRVVRQSAVDWLLDAIIRAGSPAAWADQNRVIVAPEKNETLALVTKIKDSWLVDQETYHRRNARYLSRMSKWLENTGILLNFAVMLIVLFDIALILAKAFHLLPAWIKPATPWIVLITAIVPAAVASVNLLRFQSECQRLAERSLVLVQILGGRRVRSNDRESKVSEHSHSTDVWSGIAHWWPGFVATVKAWLDRNGEYWPLASEDENSPRKGGQIQKAEALERNLQEDHDGAHLGRVMHFTENCAEIFVQEVSEWSVLYAKDLMEP